MANSLIASSTTAASNTDVGGNSIAEGQAPSSLNNAIRQWIAYAVQRFGSSVSVASASTVALGDQEEQYVTISGTTTITSFGTPAVANKFGYWVKFDGALTLTHNATSLILPGGANITTAAGDVAFFQHEGSGNWRCLSYQSAAGVGAVGGTTATDGYVLTANGSGVAPTWQAPATGSYAAKTADYTIISTDRNSVINWTTAGFTATLTAAATLGSGFSVTIINSASSGVVTIDPNSTETLDALTTRKLSPGDRVRIVCDGSNWFTVDGDYSFESSEISITADTSSQQAHGLGKVPYSVQRGIRCKTTDLNYAVGDEIMFAQEAFQDGVAGITVSADTTNIDVTFNATLSGPIYVQNKTTRANTAITAGSWRVFVRARAR